MDIKNENETRKENKNTGNTKAKGGKIKKVEGKKPGPSGLAVEKLPESRGRAKSTLVNPFDNKKPINSKKDSKPLETIGNDRFNLLKSMFEKKAEPVAAKQEPFKFEPKKLSGFQLNQSKPQEENKIDSFPNKPSGISDAIKKRMEDLMNSNKRPSAQPKIDPILEQRKFTRDSEDNFDYEDEDQEEDIGISEDEDISEKDDAFSESEEEKNEKNELIEEKDEKEDSFHADSKKEVEEKKNFEIDVKNDNIKETKNLENFEPEEFVEKVVDDNVQKVVDDNFEKVAENNVETENKMDEENDLNNKSHNEDDI